MRILLTGANGQVGHALRRSLPALGEVVCATRDGRLADGTPCEVADLARPDELETLLQRTTPDVVVNAAAYTAVDRAETERDAAFLINAETVGALARACAEQGTLLVHYSTDYVFPGNEPRPQREDDPTGPLNVYGASKLAGEQAIRASECQHLIFRISWVYAAYGHNFLRTMLRLAGECEELRVVHDQVGAPTPAEWIAKATAQAIAQRGDRSGTWHLAAGGETAWHGFAEAIFAEALRTGLIQSAPQLISVPTSDYPTPARRPASSRLDTSRFAHDFGITLPDWRQGVVEVISTLRNQVLRTERPRPMP
ncbi:dTDP-4-dehydrorhamnose reductase [Luteimonas sp. MJ293]|uniref:dTDP-4-dehydrorhamnose reductase n=1 Tax=Luteimonas sp. MJ146 TaxID=3129240 RepID=UPI0031BA912F